MNTLKSIPARLAGASLLATALAAFAPIGHAEQATASSSTTAATPAPAAAAATPAKTEEVVIPILSNDQIIQKALLELDKFLESNPQLEETLRTNPAVVDDADFMTKNPAWQEFVKRRPVIVRAFRAEQRFMLHRAFARLARTSLLREEIAQFDAFLDQNPDIAGQLHKRPNIIRDSAFLSANPKLSEFLAKHPALSTALLSTPAPQGPGQGGPQGPGQGPGRGGPGGQPGPQQQPPPQQPPQ